MDSFYTFPLETNVKINGDGLESFSNVPRSLETLAYLLYANFPISRIQKMCRAEKRESIRLGKRSSPSGMVIDYKRSALTSVRFHGETFNWMGMYGVRRSVAIVVTNLKRGVEFSHVLYLRSPTTATWRPIVGRPFAEPLRVDTRSPRCEHDRNYRYGRAWMRARLAAERASSSSSSPSNARPGEVCAANS